MKSNEKHATVKKLAYSVRKRREKAFLSWEIRHLVNVAQKPFLKCTLKIPEWTDFFEKHDHAF